MKPRIIFHRVMHDVPEFGSSETRAVSRVYFDLEADGGVHRELHVDIEEPAGCEHRAQEMQVGSFAAPCALNRKTFEGAVLSYYQGLVTSAGYGKHHAKGTGLRSHGDTLGLEQVLEL